MLWIEEDDAVIIGCFLWKSKRCIFATRSGALVVSWVNATHHCKYTDDPDAIAEKEEATSWWHPWHEWQSWLFVRVAALTIPSSLHSERRSRQANDFWIALLGVDTLLSSHGENVVRVASQALFFFCDGFAEAVLVEDDSRRRPIFIVAAGCCSYLLMLLIFDLLFSSFEMGIERPLLSTLLPI